MPTENDVTLQHAFSDLQSLKRAFMPFVVNGGIFIPTQNSYQLGDFVKAIITLPETNHDYTFTGEVIWISPKSSNNHSGIGITCSGEEGHAFKKATMEMLSDLKGSERDSSDTM